MNRNEFCAFYHSAVHLPKTRPLRAPRETTSRGVHTGFAITLRPAETKQGRLQFAVGPLGCSLLFGPSPAVCCSALRLQFVVRLFGCSLLFGSSTASAIRPFGFLAAAPTGAADASNAETELLHECAAARKSTRWCVRVRVRTPNAQTCRTSADRDTTRTPRPVTSLR